MLYHLGRWFNLVVIPGAQSEDVGRGHAESRGRRGPHGHTVSTTGGEQVSDIVKGTLEITDSDPLVLVTKRGSGEVLLHARLTEILALNCGVGSLFCHVYVNGREVVPYCPETATSTPRAPVQDGGDDTE